MISKNETNRHHSVGGVRIDHNYGRPSARLAEYSDSATVESESNHSSSSGGGCGGQNELVGGGGEGYDSACSFISNSNIVLRSQSGGGGDSSKYFAPIHRTNKAYGLDVGDGVPSAFDTVKQTHNKSGYSNANVGGFESATVSMADEANVNKSETDSILSEFLTNLRFEETANPNNNNNNSKLNHHNGCKISNSNERELNHNQKPSLGKMMTNELFLFRIFVFKDNNKNNNTNKKDKISLK